MLKTTPINISTEKVKQFFGKKKTDGQLGIEIECEGNNILNSFDILTQKKFWKLEPEGSLRNGYEFVTIPIKIESLEECLKEFQILTSKATLIDSIRTSVHIHINVQDLTLLQIYSILTTYWLIEDALVALNGPNRQGNLFCLRAKDAEALPLLVIKEIQNRNFFSKTAKENMRYGAVNLDSLRKFGSLEFRFMKGTSDINTIALWARALFNICHLPINLRPLEILQIFEDYSLKSFLNRFLDTPEIEQQILEKSSDKDSFTNNYGLMYELALATERVLLNKPKIMIEEDSFPDDILNPENQSDPYLSTNEDESEF